MLKQQPIKPFGLGNTKNFIFQMHFYYFFTKRLKHFQIVRTTAMDTERLKKMFQKISRFEKHKIRNFDAKHPTRFFQIFDP